MDCALSMNKFNQPIADMPVCIPGFEHINRYWDAENKTFAAKLLPGEYYITKTGEMITTVLGSCVSACIRDVTTGIGGMNHFMLPMKSSEQIKMDVKDFKNDAMRYGNWAMEHLINDILKLGCKKTNLEIKLFGGGQIFAHEILNIGEQNAEFAIKYLNVEHMKVAAKDLGGNQARKVNFFPKSGRALVKRFESLHNETIVQREEKYYHSLVTHDSDGDIELFTDSKG